MMEERELQEAFAEDIKMKRQIAQGRNAPTLMPRKRGKMVAISDYLRGSELRAYTGLAYARCGEVRRSNMYTEILSKEQYHALTREEKKAHLTAWLTIYDRKTIVEKLGFPESEYRKGSAFLSNQCTLLDVKVKSNQPQKPYRQTDKTLPKPNSTWVPQPEQPDTTKIIGEVMKSLNETLKGVNDTIKVLYEDVNSLRSDMYEMKKERQEDRLREREANKRKPLGFEANDVFTGEEIGNYLLRIADLLMKNRDYHVVLSIQEHKQ